MKNIGNLREWSLDKTRKFIEYGNSENYIYYGIVHKLIGIIRIYKHDSYYNLTIFTNKKYVHSGYSSKALVSFLKKMKNRPIDVLSSNKASINFFTRHSQGVVNKGRIYRLIIRE